MIVKINWIAVDDFTNEFNFSNPESVADVPKRSHRRSVVFHLGNGVSMSPTKHQNQPVVGQ